VCISYIPTTLTTQTHYLLRWGNYPGKTEFPHPPSIYQVLSIVGHLRGFLLNLEGTRVPRIRASVVRHLNHAQTRINTGSNASFRVRVRYQRHPQ
jgi:hypothetical protein